MDLDHYHYVITYSLLLGKLLLFLPKLILLSSKFLHLCLQLLRFTCILGRKKGGGPGRGRRKWWWEGRKERKKRGGGRKRKRKRGRGQRYTLVVGSHGFLSLPSFILLKQQLLIWKTVGGDPYACIHEHGPHTMKRRNKRGRGGKKGRVKRKKRDGTLANTASPTQGFSHLFSHFYLF